MSIEKIIQESINKNPLGMKEALEEELRNRLALALEAKMKEDEDMDESFDLSDLSDLTLEELEDFMMSEDFDQLDEISKGTLRSYVKKADKAADKSFSSALKQQNRALKGAVGAAEKQAKHSRNFDNRATGLDRANDRLSKMKEDFDLDEVKAIN